MAQAQRRPVIAVTGPERRGIMPRLMVHLGLWMTGGRALQLRPGDAIPPNGYDGVVITGGHDVDPVLYAQESEVNPRYDPQRDAFESAIIDDAVERDLPMLGICRGAQLLNVRLGGDLFQELRSRRKHTSNRRTLLPLKTLNVEPDTRLRALLGAERIKINSLHNQGINQLGSGLKVSGSDLDNIVQAVEQPECLFLMGVQWHPEFMIYSARQRRLFRALVEAATRRRATRD